MKGFILLLAIVFTGCTGYDYSESKSYDFALKQGHTFFKRDFTDSVTIKPNCNGGFKFAITGFHNRAYCKIEIYGKIFNSDEWELISIYNTTSDGRIYKFYTKCNYLEEFLYYRYLKIKSKDINYLQCKLFLE